MVRKFTKVEQRRISQESFEGKNYREEVERKTKSDVGQCTGSLQKTEKRG